MSLLSWFVHGLGFTLGAGNAVGTASGTSSASGVGRSIAAAIGQAAGQGTALGATVGSSTGSSPSVRGVQHRFTSLAPDSLNPDKVNASDWNQAHVWLVVTTDPPSPTVGHLWTLVSGTTPDRLLELKFCDIDGVVVTLLSVYR